MRWAIETAPGCGPCREKHRKENEDDPPCDDCRPPLLPENEDAAEVFLACRNQVIIVRDQIVGLNLLAVKAAMDVFGVGNQKECMVRVMALFHEMQAGLGTQCDAKERANCEAQFGEHLDWACKECGKNKKP